MSRYRTYTPNDDPPAVDGDDQFMGVNMRLEPDEVPPGFLAYDNETQTPTQNVRFRTGKPTTRLGLAKPAWLNRLDPANFPGKILPVGQLYGAQEYKDPDDGTFTIIAADGGIYRHAPGNQRVKMSLPTGVAILSRVSFCQAFNKLWCFRGRYLAPLVCSAVAAGWSDLLPQFNSADSYQAAVTALSNTADEMAYGPFQAVTSVTYIPTMVTVVTPVPHGYVTGADVTIKGASPAALNGRWNINVVDEFTFTFASSTLSTLGSGTATGTIKVSNNSTYWQALGSQVLPSGKINLSGLSESSTTVTATTATAHGYTTGQYVTIFDAVPSGYNGTYQITVTTTTAFTYTAASGLGTVTTTGAAERTFFGTWSGGVATITTNVNHGFTTGQYVTLAGCVPAAWNGTYPIVVASSTTFTFGIATTPGTMTLAGTCATSVTLAGQTPDSNPEAWQQVFNILPNADDAVYINNRLVVPTAYTPSNTGYDSTAVAYTKKDYLVATDILDDIHFDFVNNQFRINEGSDDEIQAVVVYNQTTLLIFKSKSWGILTGIGVDLSAVALNMFGASYGACALRSAVTAGEDVLFPSTKRGICSCYMTQLGQVRGTDTPFSNEMQKVIERINWNFAAGIRMAWWNDCLYCAVPLNPAPIAVAAEESAACSFNGVTYYNSSVDTYPGGTFQVTFGPNETGYWNPGFIDNPDSPPVLVAPGSTLALTIEPNSLICLAESADNQTPTATIWQGFTGNNALLVYDYRMGFSGSPLTYDFRGGQWAGVDSGPFCVLEFFKCTVNGIERLCFIGADGFVSMLEESTAGDAIYDPTTPSGIRFADINTVCVTRGYRTKDPRDPEAPEDPKRFRRLQIVVSTLGANLSMSANTGAAFSALDLVSNLSYDRLSYFKPFNAAPWNPDNSNEDFANPGRYDYTLILASDGTLVSDPDTQEPLGVNCSTFQELTKRVSLRTVTGRYAQFTVSSSAGRLALRSVGPEATEGPRRNGVLI